MVRLALFVLVASVLLAHGRAYALPPGEAAKMVAAARRLVGTPYQLGGRMRRPGEGIDCQGVLFFAAQRIRACHWKSYSVFPTESVRDRELGGPAPGLSPIASGDLEIDRLEPGDVLLLVSFSENPAEGAIGLLDGKPVWVLHTGLYAGDGKWIVGDHFAGEVVETDLASYLADHQDSYQGVFVTRMRHGPSPRRCRN